VNAVNSFYDMFNRFDSIPECDRQTDEQNCYYNIGLCTDLPIDKR